jgi:hypothetical protein
VTVPAGATEAVVFTPAAFPQLVITSPQLWWPYQMAGQMASEPLYTLNASVSQGPVTEDTAPVVTFGIRSVTTYLTAPSAEAPNGVRVFEVNGVPFVFRGGGWSENLFLHYSASDLANQISLIKSMGLNGIRTEGKEMPQDFYNQMDAAGIMIDAGFQCCDAWAPSSSGRGVTTQEYHVMYNSALTIGEQLRDHPSVINFSWSDNAPIKEQEVASEEGFAQSGFQDPIVSSAEYNTAALYGPSGEKEGPYDWVPPSYWYDTTHDSNTAVDSDNTETNVGGSFGFDSEQGSGDTVPTMDSIDRFMSPSDQAALWECPGDHQFHTNYESSTGDCPAAGVGSGTPEIGSHSGYSFGTLDNLDTAIQNRYGNWDSLAQYVEEAQVQNFEDTRAQFEAFIDHWDNYPTPSTGTDYWQMNKGWPTLLWDLYNYDYDEAGSYFGAKKGDETLHVLYALDTGQVTIDNLSGRNQTGLTVESRVYNLAGKVTDRQTSRHLSLAPQQVVTGVLTPKVPASTAPPTPAQTYFIELVLRQHGVVVDRNVYWLSTQQDVVDWTTTEGNPQADNGSPLSQYANMTALQSLPTEPVNVVAATTPSSTSAHGDLTTDVTITNPRSNPAVAFFLRVDVRRGSASGVELPGDNEVLPVTYSDNDITLWPGQSQTIEATYSAAGLDGATPVVSVFGWNVGTGGTCGATQSCSQSPIVVAAPEIFHGFSVDAAPGTQYFGVADGTPLAQGTAAPEVNGEQVPSSSPPVLSVSETAFSPTTSPSTSFTQGDSADTYTITVTNVSHVPTDGTTPVVVTDVVGNNGIDLNYVSISGSGWTCDDSQNPTITCTETGGAGGGPAVLGPGQSFPPLTLTVSVTNTAGYGSQNSVAGLNAVNAVSVSGGLANAPSFSIAPPTPIVGLPDLTNDYAIDGAFRQGDAADQYQETVINQGGGPTNGNPVTPIAAVFTPGAGETIQALYGSGWTCNLTPITSPFSEPADTCYRSDVLPGENGEEPPITEVVSVSPTATPDTTTATEPKVVVSGGGAANKASTSDSTTIIAAATLSVGSSHTGNFAQGGTADVYTLTATAGPGGPTFGQVVLADTLPPGVTGVAMTGSGWTCPSSLLSTLPTCYRSDVIPANTSYPPVTLTVSVAGNAPTGSAVNTVELSGGGAFAPAVATDATTITGSNPAGSYPPPAPPALTGTATTTGTLAQGDASDTFSLTVKNAVSAGPSYGLVNVTDTLPAGLDPQEISGNGWTCSLDPVIPAQSPDTFEPDASCFRVDALSPGLSYPPITLTASVANNAPPSLLNTVTVTGGGMAGPTVTTDAVPVAQLPQLVVTSAPSSHGLIYAPFAQGDGPSALDDYNIIVANDGFAPTSGTVGLSVDLPAGFSAYAFTAPAGWACAVSTASCSSSTGLAAGAQADITLQVTVASDAPAWAQAFIQASGGGEVPTPQVDTNNDYNSVDNGGVFAQPTYVTQTAS